MSIRTLRASAVILIAELLLVCGPAFAQTKKFDGTFWRTNMAPAGASVQSIEWAKLQFAGGLLAGLKVSTTLMVKAWTDDPNDVFTEQEWKRRVEQLER